MKTKLWLFLATFALVFSACEKEDSLRGGPPSHSKAGGQGSEISSSDGFILTAENDIYVTDLIAGQTNIVGEVTVEDLNGSIKVTYRITENGWWITETHLHVSREFGDIPTNGPGNPVVGHFKYSESHDLVEEYSVTIDKNDILPHEGDINNGWDGCYYIAAHAVVSGGEGETDFAGIAEWLPGTADVKVTAPKPGGNTYFPKVNLSEADKLNGDYPGWCLESDVRIADGTFNVYSSAGDLPDGYPENFFNKVNWILNQNFVGTSSPVYDAPDFTSGDVQIAIWVIKLGESSFEDAVDDIDDAALNTNFIGSYNPDNIDYIVKQANSYGDDFVPVCGDVFVIILTNEDLQDIVIEYPVPCQYGEETAWGKGSRFVDRGNWAMYFKICSED